MFCKLKISYLLLEGSRYRTNFRGPDQHFEKNGIGWNEKHLWEYITANIVKFHEGFAGICYSIYITHLSL